MNINCVICSDLFGPSDDVHVTPCGHIFHFACLSQWLERSRSCPQCRNKCSLKNIHRVYFNVANIDTSIVDVGSLQQLLDNANLQVREKQKELSKQEAEVLKLKDMQKKTMKTITALEKKLEQCDFLKFSYIEQISILKTENKLLEEEKNEAKKLRQQIDLMTSVQKVLTSTFAEVEELLKNNVDTKTLATWVSALKREIRLYDRQKNEERAILRDTQRDLKAQQRVNKSLEEKILHLESENYRMNEKIKSLEKDSKEKSLPISSSDEMCISPKPKQTPSCIETVDTVSPGTSKRVKKIEESDSPYLAIKSSSIGLTPLLKLHKDAAKRSGLNEGGAVLRETVSDLSEKYSILKRPRLMMQTSTCKSTNLVYNGFGGSDKIPNFPDYPETRKLEQTKLKTTLNSRLKTGKLRKFPVSNNENMSLDKFIRID